MSEFSEFIRNATPEKKAEVYGRVMDQVNAEQLKLITRFVDKVAPLVCECGTKLVTLKDDLDGITIGCPVCNADEAEGN